MNKQLTQFHDIIIYEEASFQLMNKQLKPFNCGKHAHFSFEHQRNVSVIETHIILFSLFIFSRIT